MVNVIVRVMGKFMKKVKFCQVGVILSRIMVRVMVNAKIKVRFSWVRV